MIKPSNRDLHHQYLSPPFHNRLHEAQKELGEGRMLCLSLCCLWALADTPHWGDTPAVRLCGVRSSCCLSCFMRFLLQIASGPCAEAGGARCLSCSSDPCLWAGPGGVNADPGDQFAPSSLLLGREGSGKHGLTWSAQVCLRAEVLLDEFEGLLMTTLDGCHESLPELCCLGFTQTEGAGCLADRYADAFGNTWMPSRFWGVLRVALV